MTAQAKYQKTFKYFSIKAKEFIQFKRRIEIKYDCMNGKKTSKLKFDFFYKKRNFITIKILGKAIL